MNVVIRVVIRNVASGNPSLGRRRWWLLLPVFLLNLLSTFSFNKFMGAAAYYSARIPITSVTPVDEALQIADARRSADRFFLLFAALTLLATVLMGQIIQLERDQLRGFRLRPRYILVLILGILAVGALVHVFFVYSVVVAALVVLLMTPAIQDRMDSKGFRLVVRYLLALVLCVLTTGILVWMIDVLRWA